MPSRKPKSPRDYYARALDMEDFKDFEKAGEEWVRKFGRNKETALAKLVEMGINTPTGRLTKKYRSSEPPPPPSSACTRPEKGVGYTPSQPKPRKRPPMSNSNPTPQVRYAGALDMEDFKSFEERAERWTREACRTKETAREALRELGIVTPTGRLTKKFRS